MVADEIFFTSLLIRGIISPLIINQSEDSPVQPSRGNQSKLLLMHSLRT